MSHLFMENMENKVYVEEKNKSSHKKWGWHSILGSLNIRQTFVFNLQLWWTIHDL